MQAIVAATRTGAELLSGGEADYGTLRPGKAADLILLDADPLADVTNTRAIDRVMQGGVWLDRAALLPAR
jgi:imidazolonepropionase-like amidohydrolase